MSSEEVNEHLAYLSRKATPPKPAHIDTTSPVVTYVPTPSPIDTTEQVAVKNPFNHDHPCAKYETYGCDCGWCHDCGHEKSKHSAPASTATTGQEIEGHKFEPRKWAGKVYVRCLCGHKKDHPVHASTATTQGDEVDQAYRVGRAVGRILAEAEPKPVPQAEAQESFEAARDAANQKWWNSSGFSSDAGQGSAFDSGFEAAWNAQQAKIDALEQQLKECGKILGEVVVIGSLGRNERYLGKALHASSRAIMNQVIRAEKAEDRLAELEEKLRDTHRALELLLERNGAENIQSIASQWIEEAQKERKGDQQC
jgi:hypothetical protein